MRSQVIVSWGAAQRFTFDLDEVQPMPHDVARSWLDEQFNLLGCEPTRLTGKVLLADKVLAIAQAVGQTRFTEEAHRPWAQVYAKAVSAMLAKPVVHIDVPALSVNY
jgi:hypothetical protein